MKSFVNQPNPFKFINIVKLKLASQQRNQILQLKKLENVGQRNHDEIAEDTDAPSIESMEDDFKQQHPPLTISDLKLNLPASLNSESTTWAPILNNIAISDPTPRDSLKTSDDSVKSLISSIASEAPLIIPPTIQSLSLKSKLDLVSSSSTSVSLKSVSEQLSGVQGLIPPNDMLIDWGKPKPEFFSPPSKDSKLEMQNTEDIQNKNKTESGKLQSSVVEEEGFEIGKVVNS